MIATTETHRQCGHTTTFCCSDHAQQYAEGTCPTCGAAPLGSAPASWDELDPEDRAVLERLHAGREYTFLGEQDVTDERDLWARVCVESLLDGRIEDAQHEAAQSQRAESLRLRVLSGELRLW